MIRVTDLHKSFGDQEVLKGVNLEFVSGKITTIVGTSGCGKTVLLKHLNALLLPDKGAVLVDNVDITRLGQKELYEIRGRFGVLFQGAALLDSMTIFDNVAFPLREKTEMSESDIRKKVDERLEQVGLEGMGYKFPAELSGGMKKRAGLARALVTDPEIVLFDEPTTGLDPILAASIHQLIARTQQTFGFTGVIVSHTIPQVFDISDYVAILANGRIEEAATAKEFQESKNPIVQQFIRGETEGPIHVL
jgi:phospholipid/cholesterol/gamma-HCH transport system ATP-binding protein